MSRVRRFLIERPVFFRWCFGVAFACTLALFVVGFLLPPMGQIHPSVLQGGALLLAFAVVAMLPDIIQSGRTIKVTHGNTSVSVNAGEVDADTGARLDDLSQMESGIEE